VLQPCRIKWSFLIETSPQPVSALRLVELGYLYSMRQKIGVSRQQLQFLVKRPTVLFKFITVINKGCLYINLHLKIELDYYSFITPKGSTKITAVRNKK